jgi:hypothetical protein
MANDERRPSMASSYEEAVEALYRAAPDGFVAERKRLSAELKSAGDKAGAQKLGALEKPSISVWVVNQLYREQRERFDELLEVAAKLRGGDLSVAGEHREALAEMRRLAGARLRDAGHSANEATLRKVSASLAAIAAAGGFDPDPPGALRADRDPPGFGEMDAASFAALPKKAELREKSPDEDAAGEQAREKEQRAKEERAKKEREEQRAAARAEQRRLQAELRAAEGELEERKRELERTRRRVSDAEDAVKKAERALESVTARVRELE